MCSRQQIIQVVKNASNKTQQVIALFNVFGKKYDQNAKPFSLKEWYDFGKWIKNNNIEIEEFKKIPDKVEKDFDLNFVQRIVTV